MALTIEIANQQRAITLNTQVIIRIVRKILKAEHVTSARLSLAFVTDRKIHSLNKKFLGHDYPTDVLAFDLGAAADVGPGARRKALEGEIIISTDTARRQARAFAATPQQEVILYVVHGILHLLGYDDHQSADTRRMRAREQKLLRYLARDLAVFSAKQGVRSDPQNRSHCS
jgi:probable rRNA maturation factor